MTDPVRIPEVTTSALAAFLSSAGWDLAQEDSAKQRWTSQDERRGTNVVLLPLDRSFDDYNEVLQSAFRRVQRIFNWDSQELLTHVLGSRSDVMYIRALQGQSDGSIPIREAQTLLDSAVAMLTSAARSTVSPRSSHGGRIPNLVKEFINDDLRMGHTKRGSFVITILTRLDELPAESLSPRSPGALSIATPYEPPFQREVMSTLARSLISARDVTREVRGGRLRDDVLEQAVSQGVSAGLCEALSVMTAQEGVSGIDLSFEWAASVRSQPPNVGNVLFERPASEPLEQIRDQLSPRAPLERPASLLGYVTKLERGQDAAEGVVTVQGFINSAGERRQARVSLDGSAYREAVEAHEGRGLVEVSGKLVREGNAYWIREPRLVVVK